MKVARKTSAKRPAPTRATLTLSAETYGKIDALRGEQPRSTWVQGLINREEKRLDRQRLAQLLHEQYTPAVCRETLAVNEEFPVHEA
jgi:hypothetical protein